MAETEDNIISNTPAIEFLHVSLSFDEKRVLDDVSFRLAPNQMIIITGDSGSGKTVLLHLAIGLLRPDSGEILIEGQEIDRMDETRLLRLRGSSMGLVFQEDTLFTGMSVYENTAFRLTEHGWSEEETSRAVNEILQFVGLQNDTEKLPEEMSIGMRKRLELARALIGWPSIMLFDEPTSGLDPINARQVLDLIIRARDVQRISSLLVTKELHQIHYLANHQATTDERGAIRVLSGARMDQESIKVMVLEAGRIVFFGSPDEFQSSRQPEVLHLLQPESAERTGDSYIKDPWGRNREII